MHGGGADAQSVPRQVLRERRLARARRDHIVPVLSLGRRLLASEGPGTLADTFLLSAPAVAAGGPPQFQLRNLTLSSEPFKASSIQAVVT